MRDDLSEAGFDARLIQANLDRWWVSSRLRSRIGASAW